MRKVGYRGFRNRRSISVIIMMMTMVTVAVPVVFMRMVSMALAMVVVMLMADVGAGRPPGVVRRSRIIRGAQHQRREIHRDARQGWMRRVPGMR